MKRALVGIVLLLASGACDRHRVVTEPDLPPLAAPAPPARVVQPPEPEEVAPPPKPQELPRKPARTPARSDTVREPPTTAEPPKPAKPEVTPPAREEPVQPPGTLQTLPPANQAQVKQQVDATLAQAKRDLKQVNVKALNADAQGQYNTAKRFVEQAEQALKEQNLVLAQKLADKAATILGVLVVR